MHCWLFLRQIHQWQAQKLARDFQQKRYQGKQLVWRRKNFSDGAHFLSEVIRKDIWKVVRVKCWRKRWRSAFAEDAVEVLKELSTGCARLNLSRVVGLFGFTYKVCYFLFNGVVYLFVDGKLRFETSSLRLPTLLFQLTELLRNTAEPGRWLLCTDCATAERGVPVKDRTEMVIVFTDRTDLWDSVTETLFKGAGVTLFEALVRNSFRFLYGYRRHQVCTRWLCGQMLVYGVVL